MKNASIPDDLIYEIISRLPAKSIARCRCLSKLWRSILRRQDFTDLFVSRSLARQDFTDLLLTRFTSRPRLVILVQHKEHDWSFYSTTLPRNPHEIGSDFHMKFYKGTSQYGCSYVSGLIYFHRTCIPRDDEDVKRVICNPLTGQCVILPKLEVYSYSYLGFDPVDYEFKVLVMNSRDHYIAHKGTDFHVLTLGTGKLRWRKIKCPYTHEPLWHRICNDGVLYYLAYHRIMSYLIVCFDVRSEKFKFIDVSKKFKSIDQLINYKGKLCATGLEYDSGSGFLLKLSMWVLEDVEIQEWSKYVYSLCVENQVGKVNRNLSVSGMTSSGDIVLTTSVSSTQSHVSIPFYVFYFHPRRNTLQTVEIQGVGANHNCRAYAFVDYEEDLSAKQQNKYKLLDNLLYHSVGLAILFSLFYLRVFLALSFCWPS